MCVCGAKCKDIKVLLVLSVFSCFFVYCVCLRIWIWHVWGIHVWGVYEVQTRQGVASLPKGSPWAKLSTTTWSVRCLVSWMRMMMMSKMMTVMMTMMMTMMTVLIVTVMVMMTMIMIMMMMMMFFQRGDLPPSPPQWLLTPLLSWHHQVQDGKTHSDDLMGRLKQSFRSILMMIRG